MDGSRFDDLARSLATSRRRALKTLLGGAVAGLAAIVTGEAAEERRSRFYRAGQPCVTPDQCGSAAPCQFGVCTPIACHIGVRNYRTGQPNPNNACQFCAPTLENWTDWTTLSDGDACGTNQYCCNGDCCTDTQCCVAGVCEECGPHCTIEGVTYPHTEVFPPGGCQVCNVLNDPTGWSILSDGAVCGDAMDQVCCFGNCCIQNSCCNEERQCATDCAICRIGDKDYPNLQVNPANGCQICDTSHIATAWWPLPERTPCDTPPGGLCCDGDCCNSDECCGVDFQCTTTGCTQCRIEDVDYDDNTPNPFNDCERCEPSRSTNTWTVRPNNLSCTSTPDGFCCNGLCLPIEEFCDGVCLAPGECCNAEGDRVDGDCVPGCTIDGASYDDGAVNPDDFCQVCDVAAPTIWSPRFHPDCPPPCLIADVLYPYGAVNPANECEFCDGGSNWTRADSSLGCGNGEGICCDGVCSANCDSDGCTVDGAHYPDGTVNPANECEYCSAAASATSWSSDTFGRCGPNQDRWCCAGVCCDLGVCCNLGQLFCDPDYCHQCVIDGAVHRHGDRNPMNGCEQCNADLSPNAWVFVGPNYYCNLGTRDGVCCAGTCCASGLGCNTDGFFCDDFDS